MNARMERRRQLVMALQKGQGRKIFTPQEVALIFLVSAKTVTRWAEQNLLPAMRTEGGHRRFRAAHIWEILQTEEDLLLSRQVAEIFRVGHTTVGRWGLPSIRIPNGYIRFLKSGVEAYLNNRENI